MEGPCPWDCLHIRLRTICVDSSPFYQNEVSLPQARLDSQVLLCIFKCICCTSDGGTWRHSSGQGLAEDTSLPISLAFAMLRPIVHSLHWNK